MTTRYVRGDKIDELIARIEANGDAYWLLTDRIGSVRQVLDNTGVVKNDISYDAFGNITAETDSAFRGRYTFASREWDVETEFLYNRARYYLPEIGAWSSEDPAGFAAGDSNLFRYVVNSPTNATDPSGRQELQLVAPNFSRSRGRYGTAPRVVVPEMPIDSATYDLPLRIRRMIAQERAENYVLSRVTDPNFSQEEWLTFLALNVNPLLRHTPEEQLEAERFQPNRSEIHAAPGTMEHRRMLVNQRRRAGMSEWQIFLEDTFMPGGYAEQGLVTGGGAVVGLPGLGPNRSPHRPPQPEMAWGHRLTPGGNRSSLGAALQRRARPQAPGLRRGPGNAANPPRSNPRVQSTGLNPNNPAAASRAPRTVPHDFVGPLPPGVVRLSAPNNSANVQWLNPNSVRFSQNSAGGRGRADVLRQSMREHGWAGDPVDGVQTPVGIVTIDNTRVAVARELGIQEIPVRVHSPTERLPPDMIGRFGNARTWGEALIHRTSNQRPPLLPTGIINAPRMPPPSNQGGG